MTLLIALLFVFGICFTALAIEALSELLRRRRIGGYQKGWLDDE